MKSLPYLAAVMMAAGCGPCMGQITAGQSLEFSGSWEAPKFNPLTKNWGLFKTTLPMNGVRIIIEDTGSNPVAPITGHVIGGKFSFTAPKDNFTYKVILEAKFPGVSANGAVATGGGAGAFSIFEGIIISNGNDSIAGPLYKVDLGQTLTHTAAHAASDDAVTDIEVIKEGDVWAVFHGMADMVKEARRQLDVSKNSFNVIFPGDFSTFSSSENTIRIYRPDRYDWDVVAHEFGHAVGDETGAEHPNANPGGNHNGGNQYDYPSNPNTQGKKGPSIGLAFSEGFGTWFGTALLERSSYRGSMSNVGDGKYTDTEDGGGEGTSLDDSATKSNAYGEDCEQAVYHLFWDLHDSRNEANSRTNADIPGLQDRTALGIRGLWDILNGSNAASFSEWYATGFLSGGSATAYLPAAGATITPKDELKMAIDAGDSLAEFGMAPLLFSPAKGTKLELTPASGDPLPLFKWKELSTVNAALKFDEFTLALYTGDMSHLLFKKEKLTASQYQFVQADLDALKAQVEALRTNGVSMATTVAVVFGSSDAGSTVPETPPTGPYLSNGVELLLQDYNRAMVAVVDSSGSNTSTDPTDQRVVASKESIRRLVSLADVTADPTKVPDIAAAVDFDSSVSVLSAFADPDSVIPTLDLIDSSGGTNIEAGINTAIGLLDNINNSGSILGLFKDRSSILVFTDGQNGGGPNPVIAAIVNATSKGYRVHYGFLSPLVAPSPSMPLRRSVETPVSGPGDPAPSEQSLVTKAPPAVLATPTTIEAAVLASGGVFAQIGDAQSQVAFIQQVFAKGLTNADGDGGAGGLIVGQANTADELTEENDIKSYIFSGKKDEEVEIRVETVNFQPNVTLFDNQGEILAVDADPDQNGRVSIKYKLPYTGTFTVQVFSEDGRLGLFDIFIDVENAVSTLPVVEQAGVLVFNRQTGFFEQTVTLRNPGSGTISGFQIEVSGLPANAFVASAAQGSTSFAVTTPVPAGESITLVIEYFNPARTAFVPTLVVAPVTSVTPPTLATGTPAGGFRATDGAFVVEFSSIPGQLYYIQYSDDGMVTWQTVLPALEAKGSKVQWIDSGPPKTSKHPREVSSRYYRVAQP